MGQAFWNLPRVASGAGTCVWSSFSTRVSQPNLANGKLQTAYPLINFNNCYFRKGKILRKRCLQLNGE